MMNDTMKRAARWGVLVGALALGGLAMAGPPHGFGGGHMERLAEELDLTAEQQAKLDALKVEAKADRKEKHEEMKGLHEAFKAELLADKPNAAKVHQLVDQRQALMNDGAHEHVDRMLAFVSTLTPEQKAEMAKLMEERRGRHGGPGGPGGADGHGPRGEGGHGKGGHHGKGGGEHHPRGPR